MKVPDRVTLQKRRSIVIADLLAKAEAEDWHGVADAAMDLREMDAVLAVPLPFEAIVPQWQKGICERCHLWQWVAYAITWDQELCLACGTAAIEALSVVVSSSEMQDA
jgi:hypothetical protein